MLRVPRSTARNPPSFVRSHPGLRCGNSIPRRVFDSYSLPPVHLASVSASGQGLSQQCALEGVQAYGADVQGLGVERLEVEAGPGFELGPDLLPEPLAHLVGRGLPRPAEVAGELELQLPLADVQVGLEELEALVRRSRCRIPSAREPPAPGARRCRTPRGPPACAACPACPCGRPDP